MTARTFLCAVLLVLVCFLLAGCATTSSAPQIVKVPVPVKCKVAVPERPVMPTENLDTNATLDSIVQSLTAEVELRDGYEDRLVTAIRSCQ